MRQTRHEFPRTCWIHGRIDVGTTHIAHLIGRKKDVKLPVVIFERCGPLAATIDSASLQIVARGIGQSVHHIANGLPVHKVLRPHNGHTRKLVHRGGDHIEVIIDTNHIGIGHISPKNWVWISRIRIHLCHARQRHAAGEHQ